MNVSFSNFCSNSDASQFKCNIFRKISMLMLILSIYAPSCVWGGGWIRLTAILSTATSVWPINTFEYWLLWVKIIGNLAILIYINCENWRTKISSPTSRVALMKHFVAVAWTQMRINLFLILNQKKKESERNTLQTLHLRKGKARRRENVCSKQRQ